MSAQKVRKDAARNRARIIDAARIAFRQHGPQAPVATIARIAGVGTATLYRHFPSRELLLTAMYGAEARRRITALHAAVSNPDPWAGFVTALDTVVEMELSHPGLSDALVAQSHAIPIYEELRAHAVGDLNALVTRLHAEGIVDPNFDITDVHLILTALRGVVHVRHEDAQERAHRLIQHLTYGVKQKRRSESP